MRKILFPILLGSLTYGQNKKIDSLLNLYEKYPKKIEVLRQLSFEFENSNPEKSIYFSKLALNVSKNHKNNLEIYTSYRDLGGAYFMANKLDSAIINLNKSINNSLVSNEFKFRVLVDLANVYNQKRETNKTKEFVDEALEIDKTINSTDRSYLSKKMRLNLITSQLYQNINDFEKAFESANIALQLSKRLNDKKRELRIMNTIANIYDSKGDREKAIEIYKSLVNKAKVGDDTKSNISVWYYNLANTLMKVGKFDESKDYINKGMQIISEEPNEKMHAYYYLAKAQINTEEKDFKNALQNIQIAEEHFTKNSIFVRIADCHYFRTKVFLAKEDFSKAEVFIKKSIDIYKQNQLNQELKDCYGILSEIKAKQKNYKEAYAYYKKYNDVDDQIFSENKVNAISNAEVKYETYVKELQIKSQQLELEKEKTNRNIAISGIGFLLLFSGGGFLFFKNRQKQKELQNQNTLLGLQQNLNAMELQSLNKQLDPHEIKNLLASISPEIQEKAPESYRKMLKLFNITKASLNNNSLTDSIENQTQQIEDFLSLEKSMLTVPFEYFIKNDIENKDQQIPRLMLKNIVENAIKHGIKRTENGGKVEVSLFEKNNFITITVDDSGKGRQKAILSDSGIGTSTYQKLFATLNQKNKENATFEIIDKEQGTKVEVRIPKDYKYN